MLRDKECNVFKEHTSISLTALNLNVLEAYMRRQLYISFEKFNFFRNFLLLHIR
jgi:hypothetical protein